MKQIAAAVFIFILYFITITASVYAQSAEIKCSEKKCSNNKIVLFGESKNWYPGMWLTKTVSVKNTSDKSELLVQIRAKEQYSDTSQCMLDKHMVLSVSKKQKTNAPNTVLWAGTLNKFYSLKQPISLAVIPKKDLNKYKFIVSLNQEVGNKCQGKKTSFSLSLIFEAVKHARTAAALCKDKRPKTAPILTSLKRSGSLIKLTWKKAQNPVSYYSIFYGTSSKKYRLHNPNAGGPNTTSYTVSIPNPDSDYFFAVRAGNGCAVSNLSNEMTTKAQSPSTIIIETQTTQLNSAAQITPTLELAKQENTNMEKKSASAPQAPNTKNTKENSESVLGVQTTSVPTPTNTTGFIKKTLKRATTTPSSNILKQKVAQIPIAIAFIVVVFAAILLSMGI